MGRVGSTGSEAREGEERRLGRIRPNRGGVGCGYWVGGFPPHPGGRDFPFLFLFLFLLSPFSFEQIFSYISLGAKNILCEVLLTIMVYAYDEMSYEVGSRG
jgi:hypothetical protein